MAETNEVDDPHIPTALILRMTARLWRLPPHHRDGMSAEREPVLTRGAAR